MHVSSLEGGQEVKDKEMWSKKKREREGGGGAHSVSDPMTLMPLEGGTMCAGDGGAQRWIEEMESADRK